MNSLIAALLCVSLLPLASCQVPVPAPVPVPTPQPFATPETCSASTETWFRTGDLTCVRCPVNTTVAQDGLSCECVSGYYRQAAGGEISCMKCAMENTVTTADGLFCLECQQGTSFSSSTQQCARCPSLTQVFTDTLPSEQSGIGNRQCEPCPLGTWADETGFTCVECGVPDCAQCDDVSGGLCLSSSELPQLPANPFLYYAQHFEAAVDQCRASNTTACQLLANLCVLQNYLTSDPACQESLLLIGPHLPPLYYLSQGAREVLTEEILLTTTYLTRDETSLLPLVLASFSLNGTFLGLEEELTQQILLCPDRPSRHLAARRVGVYYLIQCSLTMSQLMEHTDRLYDLFLRDEDQDTGSVQLVPLPVLVTNYRTEEGAAVNERERLREWQLVRRFYLAESVTNDPQYVERMELKVTLTSRGIRTLPYLKLTYASWTPSDTSSDTVPSLYKTQYSQNILGLLVGLPVTTFFLSLFVMCYSCVKTNGFLRRSGTLFCQLHTIVYVCVELCGGISFVIFIILILTSTFYIIFFKGQIPFILTLPIGEQELVFQILLGIAFVFRVVHTVYLLWYQCNVDIFFMDWERPKGLLLSSNLNAEATPTSVSTPVSIWRTYFVANEWNEIQSLRRINHTLMLILVLLFLEVVGLGHLAERDPVSAVSTSEERYSAPSSDILRFSISSLVFVIIAVILRVYVYLIHERYVEHKLHQFVDLCSVSNISVLISPHNKFGYYIHGHSVHGHADTDMRQMNSNLIKEQDNMCGRRGLEVESDLQTYEVAFTTAFRIQFDRILGPLRAEKAEGTSPPSAASLGPRSEGQGLSETVIKAYEAMNNLLTTFIERSINGMDYSIKNKLLPERVFGMEFYDTENNSIFYRDPSYSFDQILFYGHFWNLLQVDFLVFAVVDLAAQNFLLAGIITYLVSWIINFARDALGRRNLAKKTLVDSRFLI